VFLGIRITLSVAIAQLTGIFVSLLIFSHDIDSPIQTAWLNANAGLIKKAATLVDTGIERLRRP